MKKLVYILIIFITGNLVVAQDLKGIRIKVKVADYKAAKAEIDELLEKNPDNDSLHYYLGTIKYKTGDKMGAMKAFNKVVEINPKFYMVFKDRGRVKAELGDYRGSVKDFTAALNLKSDLYPAIFDRALSYYFLKEYSLSDKDFTLFLEKQPKDAEAYYRRGHVRFDNEDKEAGCLDWSKAGELGFAKAYETIKSLCN